MGVRVHQGSTWCTKYIAKIKNCAFQCHYHYHYHHLSENKLRAEREREREREREEGSGTNSSERGETEVAVVCEDVTGGQHGFHFPSAGLDINMARQ